MIVTTGAVQVTPLPRDPAFPPENARLLLDVTRSKSLADRPVDDLRRVAEYLAKRGDRVGHRCAILAESDVHFGLMRMAVVHGAHEQPLYDRVVANNRYPT